MAERRGSAEIVMSLAVQLERELATIARRSWEGLALAKAHKEVLALAERLERKAAAESGQKARRRKGVDGFPGRPKRKRKKGQATWHATSRSEKHVRLDLD